MLCLRRTKNTRNYKPNKWKLVVSIDHGNNDDDDYDKNGVGLKAKTLNKLNTTELQIAICILETQYNSS